METKKRKLKDQLLEDHLKKKLKQTIMSLDAFLAPTPNALLDEGMEADLGDNYQSFTTPMDHKINKNIDASSSLSYHDKHSDDELDNSCSQSIPIQLCNKERCCYANSWV